MGEPLSRRDFLKLSGAGLAAAALEPDALNLLGQVFAEASIGLDDRLAAAGKNLGLFLATSGQRIPETGTPIHPDARTDENIMSAFYPPLLDWQVLQRARAAFSQARDAEFHKLMDKGRIIRPDQLSPETAAQQAAKTVVESFVGTDYYLDVVMGGQIKTYLDLPNAVRRWQSFDPERLQSPEPGRFSDPQLQDLAELLASMFPVPGVLREGSKTEEGAWGSSGKERLEIATKKILELDESLRQKMFILVFGHELSHLLDIWMSANLGTIFGYLPKDGRLFELFSMRGQADAIRTLATDGHTQVVLALGGTGVKDHPWELFDFNTTALRVGQSLLLYPTSVFETGNMGALPLSDPQGDLLAALMDFDENRIDYYLGSVISRQFPGGLTPDQIKTTDWSKVKGLGLAGAALETFKRSGAGLLGEENGVPVPPRKLAGLLGPQAVQLLTTGEYTDPIPPAVLQRFYWGSTAASRELLAHVGSTWFYLESGLAVSSTPFFKNTVCVF